MLIGPWAELDVKGTRDRIRTEAGNDGGEEKWEGDGMVMKS